MVQVIMATVEDGILKPDQPVTPPSGTRVQLIIQPVVDAEVSDDEAWAEMEKLWAETKIDSGGKLLTRDQLHERR